MSRAAEGMREILADVDVRATRARRCWPTPTRALLTTGEECRAELVEHLTRGVDWVARGRDDDRRRESTRSSRSARARS